MACVITLHIGWGHMLTTHGGKSITRKAAIQAEKALPRWLSPSSPTPLIRPMPYNK
jgi:hypothetical protein